MNRNRQLSPLSLLGAAFMLVYAHVSEAATVIALSDAAVGSIPSGTSTIYIDGTDANFTTGDGVIWDGTTTFDPNNFNNNLVNSGPNEDGLTLSSYFFSNHVLQLSNIPVTTRGGVNYFAFVMDAQETNSAGGRPLLTSDMTINIHTTADYLDPTEVWRSPNAVQINGNLPASEGGGAQNLTDQPLGQGADLLVLVPVETFYGYSTDVFFEWVVVQEDSDNGDDEWALAPGTTFFDPGIILGAEPAPPAVPEPSAILPLGTALLLSLLRRQRH